MTHESEHGEPGHKCHVYDASRAIAGIIISPSRETPGALVVETWASGATKRAVAEVLHQVADEWEAEADDDETNRWAAGLN